ncbi:hypothetical protein ABVK25_008730 [Lepraria finkii]|uniref:Uncharacterized protein n=1 Tax=Lepraria finkii TaxID=1340010 RepID=A0ABR4AZA9_9LECA
MDPPWCDGVATTQSLMMSSIMHFPSSAAGVQPRDIIGSFYCLLTAYIPPRQLNIKLTSPAHSICLHDGRKGVDQQQGIYTTFRGQVVTVRSAKACWLKLSLVG